MSSRAQIERSYDLGNDFFALWLPAMSYSCGLHEGTGSEEEAQRAKLRWIADAAGVAAGQRVIDVGCGWGTALDYLVRERGVAHATGITLSKAQYEYAAARGIPRAELQHVDYRSFAPRERYDAAISIGMLEHVATPEERRSGRHLEVYRDYFARLRSWTRPGARFGLQLVLSARLPRDPADARLLAWGSRQMFPGAIAPRLEDVVQAAHPDWEVLEVRTRRRDYALTAAAWLERLRGVRAGIETRFGAGLFADHERYLEGCVQMFERGFLSLGQLSLQRSERTGRSTWSSGKSSGSAA